MILFIWVIDNLRYFANCINDIFKIWVLNLLFTIFKQNLHFFCKFANKLAQKLASAARELAFAAAANTHTRCAFGMWQKKGSGIEPLGKSENLFFSAKKNNFL